MSDSHQVLGLKKEAEKFYLRWLHGMKEYSCGANLAAYINPQLATDAHLFNEMMRELKRIDPNCPEYTPLPEGKK